MELMEAIRGRRSIRRYKPDPVPEEALRAVLEAVKWSPSWANTQCLEVIVIKDLEAKTRLLEAIPRTNPAFAGMSEAPIFLVLCAKKGVSGFYKGGAATVKGDWLMFDTGLAMQNLCLAAHGLGLGTVVVGRFGHKRAEEILGVPPDVEVIAITPLGYPAMEASAPKRKEISEFVFHERYGEK